MTGLLLFAAGAVVGFLIGICRSAKQVLDLQVEIALLRDRFGATRERAS